MAEESRVRKRPAALPAAPKGRASNHRAMRASTKAQPVPPALAAAERTLRHRAIRPRHLACRGSDDRRRRGPSAQRQPRRAPRRRQRGNAADAASPLRPARAAQSANGSRNARAPAASAGRRIQEQCARCGTGRPSPVPPSSRLEHRLGAQPPVHGPRRFFRDDERAERQLVSCRGRAPPGGG